MARTILIAAGGTGGHLFPGIAVADELKRRDAATRIVFVGTPRGLEGRLVPSAGYELELLPILPLKSVGLARMARGLVALPWALVEAARLVRRLRPAAVLGAGGYAGGPVVLMAALMGIPTVVLEPNARPGFTNRILRPFVRHAACSYEEARRAFGSKGVVTGNPVRGGFARLAPKWHVPPLTLLAFGGSQGARIINRALVEASRQFEREFGAAPKIRGSLHFGPVIVGEIGDVKRAIVFNGDVMNTAARLEELSRNVDGGFIASRAAMERFRSAPPRVLPYRIGHNRAPLPP